MERSPESFVYLAAIGILIAGILYIFQERHPPMPTFEIAVYSIIISITSTLAIIRLLEYLRISRAKNRLKEFWNAQLENFKSVMQVKYDTQEKSEKAALIAVGITLKNFLSVNDRVLDVYGAKFSTVYLDQIQYFLITAENGGDRIMDNIQFANYVEQNLRDLVDRV
ncbi:MAG: hypothetical protein MPJ05_07290 [Nitrosopumilus sp.]|nr:hypothetical protein [Nitrosopumilus sp.]